jgi:hypothetical protein
MLLECANLLKRLCHEMNLLLKAYNIKQVLSVQALMVFKIFASLLMILKILSVTLFKDPFAAVNM